MSLGLHNLDDPDFAVKYEYIPGVDVIRVSYGTKMFIGIPEERSLYENATLSRVRVPACFSHYVVTREGLVLSLDFGRRIKPRTNHGGYREVKLVDDAGRRRWVKVHNLVLEAFVGPRPSPKHHGAHKDGNKSNNHVDNLAWKLPVENEADKKKHGTAPKGRVKDAKTLSPRERFQVWKDVVMLGRSCTVTGKKFGVHRSTVAKIVKKAKEAKQNPLVVVAGGKA